MKVVLIAAAVAAASPAAAAGVFPQKPPPHYCQMYFCPQVPPPSYFEATARTIGHTLKPSPMFGACTDLEDMVRVSEIARAYDANLYVQMTPSCGYFFAGTTLVIRDERSYPRDPRPAFVCLQPTTDSGDRCYWAALDPMVWYSIRDGK